MANTDEEVLAVMRFYRLIQNLRAKELECQYQIRELVATARAEGMTWASIGDAVGTSTQAAWERYATHDRGVPEYDQQQLPISD